MKAFAILLAVLLATATPASAGITVKDRLDLGQPDENIRAGVQTVCIDGQKFIYAFGWAAQGTARGVGAGGGVSIIQVYEETDGKVVPARCD